jgi:AcrR family transcriptional regulator
MDNSIKNSILENAKYVFAKYGFRKTTLEDIARAVGKGKTSLYYYFKNKEDIFEATINMEIDKMKNEFIDALEIQQSPRQKLRTYINLRMELFLKLISFYPTFRQEFAENWGYIERIRARYDAEELSIIKSILQEGINSGEFEIRHIDLTAQAIIKAMKGFEFPWAVDQGNTNRETDIDALLEVLFFGVVKRN